MTNLEKLQEFLNKCIELGRQPRQRNIEYGVDDIDDFFTKEGISVFDDKRSYHDLFSYGSGLMQFVKWANKGEIALNPRMKEGEIIADAARYSTQRDYHAMMMGPLPYEYKIDYFLSNALLPE